jgi:predicted RNase H-like HicB family nuclease
MPPSKIKIIVERHRDGYVAYPIGMKGVVVGQGDSYEEALKDVRSAVRFHVKSFGADAWNGGEQILEAFVAEAEVS